MPDIVVAHIHPFGLRFVHAIRNERPPSSVPVGDARRIVAVCESRIRREVGTAIRVPLVAVAAGVRLGEYVLRAERLFRPLGTMLVQGLPDLLAARRILDAQVPLPAPLPRGTTMSFGCYVLGLKRAATQRCEDTIDDNHTVVNPSRSS
eukprot:COSAG02_NODE_19889_length_853_cov_0.904074_2_plen_149_part_00